MQDTEKTNREKDPNSYMQSVVVDFAYSTNTNCSIYNGNGNLLFNVNGQPDDGQDSPLCFNCVAAHMRALREARNYGTSYIYTCPCGFTFFCAPVISPEVNGGGLVCGPFLMTDPEDFVNEEAEVNAPDCVSRFLHRMPVTSPEQVTKLSELFSLVSAHLSDGGDWSMAMASVIKSQQSSINMVIQRLKAHEDAPKYPYFLEKELRDAIISGNSLRVQSILNEILGNVYFTSGGKLRHMRARIAELMVLMSRATIEAGAVPEDVLAMNDRFFSEIEYHRSLDDLTLFMTKVYATYSQLIVTTATGWHADVVYRAIGYIKQNYTHRITLEQISDYVFLSPSYFCKIFKMEMKMGLTTYLNKFRIDRCMELLLTTTHDVSDISKMVGFEDQSYFCKVFKKYTGVTPGKYRKCRGNPQMQKLAAENPKESKKTAAPSNGGNEQ